MKVLENKKMLEKLWPFATGMLVFFGFLVLFSFFNSIFRVLGLEHFSLVWLICICFSGLTIGWQARGRALLLNVILCLIFFVTMTIGFAIPAALLSQSKEFNLGRVLLITLLVIPSSFLGEKLYWRLRK